MSYIAVATIQKGSYPWCRIEFDSPGHSRIGDPMEFCPKCLSPQNMRLSTSVREQTDAEGAIKKILTKNYQCEVCHSFVRGEDIEVSGDDIGGATATNVT